MASMRELVRPVSDALYEDMLERFGDNMRAAVRTGAATKKAVYTALDDVEKARFRTHSRMVTGLLARTRMREKETARASVGEAREATAAGGEDLGWRGGPRVAGRTSGGPACSSVGPRVAEPVQARTR